MSCDIYAKPDLSRKVRYNRKVQEDEVEWEEREVDIYESADAIGHNHTDVQSCEGGSQDEKRPAAAHRKPLTALVLCVGLLCCLLLTGIILFIHSTAQLQKTLSVNNNQLKSSYEELSTNYSQLQNEIKQLKDKIEGKCPEGWERFGCSCYFKSSERRTWSESRSDCRNKGADLVVINNKEEQNFITGLKVGGHFWIGLRATERRQEWVWEWVDGSPLTEMFWESGLSQYPAYQHAAASCYPQSCWADGQNVKKYWVCEK